MFFKLSKKSLAFLCLLSNLINVHGKTDCDALSSLYKGFKIESRISWKENTNSCCSQSGIECADNRIIKIDLKEKQLKGSISDEITSLTELTYLDLRYNNVTGAIPENINSLSKLYYLNLGANYGISGTIPKQICSLKNLSELYLYNNLLNGEIPECIGELPKIIELCLDNNNLEGTIPSSIGELSNLKHLDLENNKLTGIIPESFAKLKNVEKINLQGNKDLVGNLPEMEGISSCLYTNTNLCVKEGSKVCSNNLRKCTEEDFKKVEELKAKQQVNKPSNDNNKNDSNNNDDDNSSSGGISIGVIILIIVLVIIAIVVGILICRKKTKDGENTIIKSLSRNNILPISTGSPHQSPQPEKSFVVLPAVKDNVSLPPKLTLDESIFTYVDVNSKADISVSLNEDSKISKASTGIDQEQYQNQMQYQNLIHNQSYYLS